MKKIAFFSPLNPIKSGISDYSEDLLPHLSRYFEIDVYVMDGFKPSNHEIVEQFNIFPYSKFEANYDSMTYDSILYQMGNNYEGHKDIYEIMIRYPGVVVLHDYSLHHFYAEKTIGRGDVDSYKNEMLYAHGYEGIKLVDSFLSRESGPPWESKSMEYPMNQKILDSAAAIIVHSQFSMEKIREIAPDVPVEVIPIPTPNISEGDSLQNEQHQARKELEIPEDLFVISSLGFANQTKRIDKVITALAKIKIKFPSVLDNFRYYIVGEISKSYSIMEMVEKNNLCENVVCTGYVELSDFDKYIIASDMCFNLRYPTQGENSASLVKILGRGKPVVATDIGTFSEFPDEFVMKIGYGETEVDDIVESIIKIRNKESDFDNLECLNYVTSSHSLENLSKMSFDFISKVISGEEVNVGIVLKNYMDNYIREFQKTGIRDEEILGRIISNNMDDLNEIQVSYYKKHI